MHQNCDNQVKQGVKASEHSKYSVQKGIPMGFLEGACLGQCFGDYKQKQIACVQICTRLYIFHRDRQKQIYEEELGIQEMQFGSVAQFHLPIHILIPALQSLLPLMLMSSEPDSKGCSKFLGPLGSSLFTLSLMWLSCSPAILPHFNPVCASTPESNASLN